MRKNIVTLALAGMLAMSFGATAVAGEYQHAVAQQQYCDGMAQMSVIVFNDSRNNGTTKEHFYELSAKSDEGRPEVEKKIITFAINYGHDDATDAKDAYMKTWAYCMDAIN